MITVIPSRNYNLKGMLGCFNAHFLVLLINYSKSPNSQQQDLTYPITHSITFDNQFAVPTITFLNNGKLPKPHVSKPYLLHHIRLHLIPMSNCLISHTQGMFGSKHLRAL